VSGLLSVEKNPFLGLRSVRLCLRKLDLFRTQMRAILRAAAHGDIRIMFPMISTVGELRQCKVLLNEVKEDLEESGVPYKADIRVGTMIEVPSAALLADVLAREVDFFSIGTNDLAQYALAAERGNEHVAELATGPVPAVLALVDAVVRGAQAHGRWGGVCGELAGDPLAAALLVGLGVTELSMAPPRIPDVKETLRGLDAREAAAVARAALEADDAQAVRALAAQLPATGAVATIRPS
jgi:phosphotransferase system enzyme I (PtsI)